MLRSGGRILAPAGATDTVTIPMTNTTPVAITGMTVTTARVAMRVAIPGTAAKKHWHPVLRGHHSSECAKALMASTSGGKEVKGMPS